MTIHMILSTSESLIFTVVNLRGLDFYGTSLYVNSKYIYIIIIASLSYEL